MATLRHNIEHALNIDSAENGSNTPDFILAEYLTACLAAFDHAVNQRAVWYGRMDAPGGVVVTASGQIRGPEDESRG
jgi:hypothetical protein